MLLAFHIVIIFLFIGLGFLFSLGKGAGLIAGYNTASPREKRCYDEKALCAFMGKLMFCLSGCWVIIALSAVLGRMWVLWLGLFLFFAVIVAAVVYMNTGNRFKK